MVYFSARYYQSGENAVTLAFIDYMHELRQAGVTEQQSEIHARKLALIITETQKEIKEENQKLKEEMRQEWQIEELATKSDLEITKKELQIEIEKVRRDLSLDIEKLRYDMLKFIVWTGVAVIASIGTMLAKGFHWF